MDKELQDIVEKFIAAEIGPKKGRYELLYPQKPKANHIDIIAIDKIQEDIPKQIQYQSKFASMFARKSLSELVQPEMIPKNIFDLRISINPLAKYNFSFSMNGLDSDFNYGHAETRLGYYNDLSSMKKSQEKSNGITSAISTGENNFLFTILDGCIRLYAPRLLGDDFVKSIALESSIHETVHAMTIPTVILEILNRLRFPADIEYLAAKFQKPSELIAHALTPYILSKYTKDDDSFERYARKISEKVKLKENKTYCDYPAVSEILSNNDTLENAYMECIDRIRLNR